MTPLSKEYLIKTKFNVGVLVMVTASLCFAGSFITSARLPAAFPAASKDVARLKCNNGRQIKLPVVRASGSFYRVGLTTGLQMKTQLTEFYSQYSALVNVYIPFYRTPEGLEFYNMYLKITSELFPAGVEELRGLADGSGIELYKKFVGCAQQIFLMNISPELDAYMQQKYQLRVAPESSQDCTTILLKPSWQNATFALLHNEDNAGEFAPYLYVIDGNVELANNSDVFVNFTGMSYPGMLAGNTFGFNEHGIALTSNALSPKGSKIPGIPRYFFKHMILLRSKSIDDVVEFIRTHPLAHGFSLNVADRMENIANIELYPQPNGTVTFDVAYVGARNSKADRLYHYNKYDRLNVPQIAANIISSQHRSTRAGARSPATTIEEAKTILGDMTDQNFPIYRTPSNIDTGCTLATASFDLRARKLSVYRSNPHTADDNSALHFDLP